MKHSRAASIVMRIVYAIVFIVNIQCAISFILWPDSFAPTYELSGVPGATAVQGMGIVFLMWNATYPAVIISPRRFRSLAIVVLVQQAIGLVGESWILASLPVQYSTLIAGITRFVIFDAIGLVLMLAAFIWFCIACRKQKPKNESL